ncbi:ATP-binding cassette domain-containing protein [Microbacterium sp. EYE_5]|uniref:ABC transporter ATP-binding protein n=1 Tax=unclassified Microbacterium TaxID=2609290 RepID=UPI0020041C0D|nr:MULTISPECIES: ATP-binding cassette domain-containing protein [unclassified Microbacterium]MCK6081443.1 ATP-binding cassette domain-containing protein [Microbacterium sp. EYE_382]MCK6086713.1 ATP-binding cassette domain-containing protein [Microbacterium sp. EYE_384]MCK6123789.1 ATP-binding cassette domain-containing protein [Microbacterium sp. EYE_80]MCK6126698.1 ATP-binding cassette domain-containing protein [Microbacterium sp. EYE_79]MCK6142398.1 ATP-binding cassette domain-containing pro
MSEIIRGRELTRRFRTPGTRPFERPRWTTALEDADIDVRAHAALGIIGESGSGKSTLVRLLMGLDAPTSGTVEFDGRPVDAGASARSLHWLRRRTGIVFQDPYASLDPRMSVGRIVAEPLGALGIEGDHRARVREVLADVDLPADAAERFPHEFSGGQRQRIALARALVHRPDVLVGDEPLSALDVTVRAQILGLLRDLRERDGLTLVMVSHDIGVVQNLCDDVVVMKDGRIVEEGPTEKVLLEPQVAYTRRLLASIPVIDPRG